MGQVLLRPIPAFALLFIQTLSIGKVYYGPATVCLPIFNKILNYGPVWLDIMITNQEHDDSVWLFYY
jgi:hypothetical protein